MPLTTRLNHKPCQSYRSLPFLKFFPPFFPSTCPPPFSFPLNPCVIVLNGASSRLALPSVGGEWGAVGACGGVCCTDQLQPAFAVGPHMFTGSIPPVKALLGERHPRTGASSGGSWSHLTAVFSTVFNIRRGIAEDTTRSNEIIRRICFLFVAPMSSVNL